MMIIRIAIWSAILITLVFALASCRPDLPEQSTVQQQKIQQEIDAVKQISDCNLRLHIIDNCSEKKFLYITKNL